MPPFKDIGLSKYESEVYSSLLRLRKADARTISEDSKVPTTAVYPNLTSLLKKQLIEKIDGKPAIFQSLPPEISIKKFMKTKFENLDRVALGAIQEARVLSSQLKKITEDKEIVHLSHGKDFSKEIYINAIASAKNNIYILGWKFQKIGDKYSFLHEFKKLIKRNIDIKIILTKSNGKNTKLIKDYKKEKIKIKYLPLENFSLLIKDKDECKITLKSKALSDRINIQILDPYFSSSLKIFFLSLWEKATPL